MADYIVRFIGHITPFLRPPHFPETVVDEYVFHVENLDGLKVETDKRFGFYCRGISGMFIYKSPSKVDDSKFVPDSQYFVPISMISHITTETIALTGDVEQSVIEKTNVN